jgi:broad specificity phosphatase PhoE
MRSFVPISRGPIGRYDSHAYILKLVADIQADQIHEFQPEPKPPLTIDRQLREQYFGQAEGKSWMDKSGKFEQHKGRNEKFEGAESLEDVRQRAVDVYVRTPISTRD